MAGHKKSLRGRLLLDGGNLAGSWFHRTVVLVCQHDAEGAFGLVLNRPAGSLLGDAVVASLPAPLQELPLFVGGPVQSGALSYLHGDAQLPEPGVLPNLGLGHSLESLVELAENAARVRQIRVFAGYSGWSAGQLDDEIARQAWLVEPADIELVMGADPASLWSRVLRSKGGLFRLLAELPEDPASN
jgi:putative transcriptional regulator